MKPDNGIVLMAGAKRASRPAPAKAAPVLGAHGGCAQLNVLSIASCAHQALLNNALRAQNTQVPGLSAADAGHLQAQG